MFCIWKIQQKIYVCKYFDQGEKHKKNHASYSGYFRLCDMQYRCNTKEVKLYQAYSIPYNTIEKDLVL